LLDSGGSLLGPEGSVRPGVFGSDSLAALEWLGAVSGSPAALFG
jgi:hypothetical protein